MKQYILGEDHPTMIALNELCQKAEELGIHIDFMGCRTILSHQGKEYDLSDYETDCYDGINSFPPIFEYKLTFEKEEND